LIGDATRDDLRMRVVARLAGAALAALVGLAAAIVAINFGEPTKKKLILSAAACVAGAVGLATRRPALVLLPLWILALPYNRMYYVFDGLVGNQGPQGPYVIPADGVFVALLGLWVFESAVLKRRCPSHGIRLHLWLVPLAVAAIISGLQAERMSWAMFELFRLLKFALVLWYIRANFTRAHWWTAIAGIGASVLVQSGVAGLQMARRSTAGVFGLVGAGPGPDQGLAELGSQAVGGWLRAVGTIGHPSNLACYLLLTVPVFVALAIAARTWQGRGLSAIVAVAGLAGLGCTLSRWPAALMVLQLLMLLVVLTKLRFLRAKRAIGLACITTFLVTLMLLPLHDLIYRRLTEDLRASLDFRAKDSRIALEIFRGAPLVGVGLNNYAVHLLRYDPEIEWALENADKVRHTLKIRTFVALHNFYLFLLAETGLLGLGAMLLFFGTVVWRGVGEIAVAHGSAQAVGVGLMVGMLGVMAQGLVDFSFWVDPIFYTFALICGLIVTVGITAEPSTCPVARCPVTIPSGAAA